MTGAAVIVLDSIENDLQLDHPPELNPDVVRVPSVADGVVQARRSNIELVGAALDGLAYTDALELVPSLDFVSCVNGPSVSQRGPQQMIRAVLTAATSDSPMRVGAVLAAADDTIVDASNERISVDTAHDHPTTDPTEMRLRLVRAVGSAVVTSALHEAGWRDQLLDLLAMAAARPRIHAELACLADLARRGVPTDGSTIWTTLEPCLVCNIALHRAGVANAIYLLPSPAIVGAEHGPLPVARFVGRTGVGP